MGTNDAREQLDVCKKVTTKQEQAIRRALGVLNNDDHDATSAIITAVAILDEALK